MNTKITTLIETEHEGYYTTDDGNRIFLVTEDEIKEVQFIEGI